MQDGLPKLITDTTLRDGAQDSRFAVFPPETRLKYYDLLHRLDNDTGAIYAVEAFIYQKRDVWTLEKLLERGYEWPRVTTWTRATPKDIKLLMEVSQGKVKETGMLASASDHHIFDKLGYASKEEAIEKYLQPIRTALENNIIPRVHLEDCTRADIYGWVIPFIQRVMDESKGIAKFRICDTIGWGSPDPYAALPWGIPRLFTVLRAGNRRRTRVPRPQRLRPRDRQLDRVVALRRQEGQRRLRRPRRAHRQHVARADRRRAHPPLRRPRLRPQGARRDAPARR